MTKPIIYVTLTLATGMSGLLFLEGPLFSGQHPKCQGYLKQFQSKVIEDFTLWNFVEHISNDFALLTFRNKQERKQTNKQIM